MTVQASLLLLLLTLVMLAANAVAWQPSVGRRNDRLPGTELERFFGWPATYRAEWWQSDDPSLTGRILERAPFYWPQGEMRLGRRYIGTGAIVINVAAWLLACTLILLVAVPGGRFGTRLAVGGILVSGLLMCLWLSQRASVHL